MNIKWMVEDVLSLMGATMQSRGRMYDSVVRLDLLASLLPLKYLVLLPMLRNSYHTQVNTCLCFLIGGKRMKEHPFLHSPGPIFL